MDNRTLMNNKTYVASAIRTILGYIEGTETLREDLVETPDRIVRAIAELFDGYTTDINALFKTFDGEGADEIIIIKDIPFTSCCEHHALQFGGVAHVAYLPNGKAIGASKIPRLVNAYAHRLQIQERITEQIANALMEKLNPRGVAVILQAQHSCMICRGVKAAGSSMITSIMLGAFRESQSTRMELLTLIGLK